MNIFMLQETTTLYGARVHFEISQKLKLYYLQTELVENVISFYPEIIASKRSLLDLTTVLDQIDITKVKGMTVTQINNYLHTILHDIDKIPQPIHEDHTGFTRFMFTVPYLIIGGVILFKTFPVLGTVSLIH